MATSNGIIKYREQLNPIFDTLRHKRPALTERDGCLMCANEAVAVGEQCINYTWSVGEINNCVTAAVFSATVFFRKYRVQLYSRKLLQDVRKYSNEDWVCRDCFIKKEAYYKFNGVIKRRLLAYEQVGEFGVLGDAC